MRDKKAHAAYMRRYRKRRYGEDAEFRQRLLDSNKTQRRKWKIEALEAYGGLECVCCKETTVEFLVIDHINGGGNKERESLKTNGGWVFYTKLKKLGWPEGYQVLCHNCNSAKELENGCPHQW